MATDTVSEQVRELAEHHGMDESVVIQQAVERGVETLYRDMLVILSDENPGGFSPPVSSEDSQVSGPLVTGPSSGFSRSSVRVRRGARPGDFYKLLSDSISQYLDGELTRSEAVDALGVDVVEEVESARDAIESDVEWGLRA